MNANRHDPARELMEAPVNIQPAVERAAEAMWDIEGGDHIPWEQLSPPSKAMWRRRANAALQSQSEQDLTGEWAYNERENYRISWGG